mmetsp:Transcript_29405/g.47183  ORF Transcript_29405/g.47183 Transcript_29405/m.47183 type:complete len:514 (+) Transcript_29405:934-2475(+)
MLFSLHTKLLIWESIFLKKLITNSLGPSSKKTMLFINKTKLCFSRSNNPLSHVLKLNNPICLIFRTFMNSHNRFSFDGKKSLIFLLCYIMSKMQNFMRNSILWTSLKYFTSLIFHLISKNLRKLSCVLNLSNFRCLLLILENIGKHMPLATLKNDLLQKFMLVYLAFCFKQENALKTKISFIILKKKTRLKTKMYKGTCLISNNCVSLPTSFTTTKKKILLDSNFKDLVKKKFFTKDIVKNKDYLLNLYYQESFHLRKLLIHLKSQNCDIILLESFNIDNKNINTFLSLFYYHGIKLIYNIEHAKLVKVQNYLSSELQKNNKENSFDLYFFDKASAFKNNKNTIFLIHNSRKSHNYSLLILHNFTNSFINCFLLNIITIVKTIFKYPFVIPGGSAFEICILTMLSKQLYTLKYSSVGKLYNLVLRIYITAFYHFIKFIVTNRNNEFISNIKILLLLHSKNLNYYGFNINDERICNMAKFGIFDISLSKYSINYHCKEFLNFILRIDDFIVTSN